jgi:hypothetical protein
MKKLIILIRLALVFCGMSAGFPATPAAAVNPSKLPGSPNPEAFHSSEVLVDDLLRSIDEPGPFCSNPMPDQVKECQELEDQILASTVRIELNLWRVDDGGDGYTRVGVDRIEHATIKDGRYLVTHNHGEVSLSDLRSNSLNSISILTAKGLPRLTNMPLSTISMAVEDAETLVLDLGVYGGQGLFDMMGLSSAEFKAWESLPLQPGMEVAQVNWGGTTAHVEWVRVDDILTDSGTPRLELDNFVTLGTSGGGVFWNGYHIANTWYQRTVFDKESGTVLSQSSVAALNSTQVATQLQ